MMKSKTDFNAFDTKNKKVKNLDPAAVKNRSKGGVKKMATKAGISVAFHLILDYFVDEAGKVIGHFLDFGENKKLSKHFEQVEMKTGKMEKSMSTSPKKVSKGIAYIKEADGKKIVYFEPDKDSKIPKGQWAKILKSLRPLLNGMKALAIIGGEVVEGAKDKTTGNDPIETTTDEAPKKSLAETIRELFTEITDSLKNHLPTILSNVKEKNVSQEDMDVSSNLCDKIEALKDIYENKANDTVKNKMKEGYQAILKYESKADSIQKSVEALLGITDDPTVETLAEDTSEEASEEAKALKKLLAYIERNKKSFDDNFSKIKDDLDQSTPNIIVSGVELLNVLF